MSYRKYDNTVTPPQTWELPGVFLDQIKSGVADFLDYFNFDGHTETMPRIPTQGEIGHPGGEWCQVTVRNPSFPQPEDEPALLLWHPVEVVVEASRSEDSAWDPFRVIGHRHGLIYKALVGWKPAIDSANVILPVQRGTRDERPFRIEERNSYMAAAVYRVSLGPLTP